METTKSVSTRWVLRFRTFFVAHILNFMVYGICYGYIGGSALPGSTLDNKYFVVDHGMSTEVSHALFMYSRTYSLIVWSTHIPALIAIWIASLNRPAKVLFSLGYPPRHLLIAIGWPLGWAIAFLVIKFT